VFTRKQHNKLQTENLHAAIELCILMKNCSSTYHYFLQTTLINNTEKYNKSEQSSNTNLSQLHYKSDTTLHKISMHISIHSLENSFWHFIVP